ncbi:MAG: hypothetical protein AB8I08_10550 [Sandaracinaceae bacterium]
MKRDRRSAPMGSGNRCPRALATFGALLLVVSGTARAAAQAEGTAEVEETAEVGGTAERTAEAIPDLPSGDTGVPDPDGPTEPPVPELDDVIVAPPPPPVARPVETEEFERVEPLLQAVEPLRLPLDDGLGEEMPWDDYDPYTEHGPKGLVHLGGQLRGSGLISTREGHVPDGLSIELVALADLRFSRRSPWHFRVGLGISWQSHVENFLGAGRTVTSSPGALRLRIQPFAMDIGRYVAVRLGPSIGVQLIPRVNNTATRSTTDGFVYEAFGGGTAELSVRLLDGLLEFGVHGGVQLTGVGDAQRPGDFTPAWQTGVIAQPILGASATGLLP